MMRFHIAYFENVETLPELKKMYDSDGWRATVLYDSSSAALDGLREHPDCKIIIYQSFMDGANEEFYRGDNNEEAEAVVDRVFAKDKAYTDRVRLNEAIRESGKTIDEIIALIKQS